MTPEEGRAIFETCRAEFIDKLNSGKALEKATEVLIQEIEAFETKAFNDKGVVIYSAPLIAHAPRLKAIELLISIYGLKAPEKHDIKTDIAVPMDQAVQIARKVLLDKK